MTELGENARAAALVMELPAEAAREESAETVRLAYAADVGWEFVPESVLAQRRSLP